MDSGCIDGCLGKSAPSSGVTLDLDSTVITRYGQQEGAARGYNPAEHGRVSHHPLMAFVADSPHGRQLLAAPG